MPQNKNQIEPKMLNNKKNNKDTNIYSQYANNTKKLKNRTEAKTINKAV